MKVLLLAAALTVCAGCCGVSEEAKDLAWSIVQYQKVQAKTMKKLTTDPGAIATANALVISSQSLSEILGEPETLPELPGIEVTP